MNQKIKDALNAHLLNNGFEPVGDNDDLLEVLSELGTVSEISLGNSRHWENVREVVKVGDLYVAYDTAKTTGDLGPHEKGWEFDPSSIHEVRPVTQMVEVTTYERVKD